ncbi:MAG: hypothetical protein KDA59_08680 [Planctomycetales bacterium]|nr:hypothetical protein [Planctomycetales bacterium]
MTARVKSSIWLIVFALTTIGCERASDRGSAVAVTPSSVRAARRAFDGAPPVIPHPLQTAKCVSCHNETGRELPGMGFAPANPHGDTPAGNRVANCKQCHVFASDAELFADSSFVRLVREPRRGERQHPAAPPTIPHAIQMRENCDACHSGPAARPEIRCTHAERANCRQCHVHSLDPAEPFVPGI